MSHKTATSKRNVVQLRPDTAPHPERVSAIQDWHLAQSTSPDPAVAIVYFCITTSGQIRSHSIGVEREHSAVLAQEINSISYRVAEHALGDVAPLRLRKLVG